MAEILTFVLCDAIQTIKTIGGDIVPGLISPQIALRPMYIPSMFSFGVSVGIQGVDLKAENRVKARIEDPEGRTIYEQPEEILQKLKDEDTVMPKKYQGFNMCTEIRNLSIEKEGEYKYILIINDEIIGKKVFPIYKGKEND